MMAVVDDVMDERVKIEKVKQRYQLASVFLGTTLVALVGGWFAFSENTQRNTYDFDAEHRDFASEFLDIALSEDIHERIRLARYFSFVTIDDKQRGLWGDYAEYLEELRDREFAIAEELKAAEDSKNEAEIRRLEQEKEALERQLQQSQVLGEQGIGITLDDIQRKVQECVDQQNTHPARWHCLGNFLVGVQEVRDNALLRGFLNLDGSTIGNPAQMPWNGDFVDTVIRLTSPDVARPSNPYLARNWLTLGAATQQPQQGDILVFWRRSPTGTSGHVGFYHDEDDTHYQVLGGNQSNSVSITRISKDRLLGIRTVR